MGLQYFALYPRELWGLKTLFEWRTSVKIKFSNGCCRDTIEEAMWQMRWIIPRIILSLFISTNIGFCHKFTACLSYCFFKESGVSQESWRGCRALLLNNRMWSLSLTALGKQRGFLVTVVSNHSPTQFLLKLKLYAL